eukprot:742528-Rhodomonas_salina.1
MDSGRGECADLARARAGVQGVRREEDAPAAAGDPGEGLGAAGDGAVLQDGHAQVPPELQGVAA